MLAPGADERGRAVILSPLDEKPKSVADPLALARVRDLLARPQVRLLVDRWDEDWRRLAWLRVDGTADLVQPEEPAHGPTLVALRRKYAQYVSQRLELRPLVRIAVDAASSWGSIGDGARTARPGTAESRHFRVGGTSARGRAESGR